MSRPTPAECRATVVHRGVLAATAVLARRGVSFTLARSADGARAILDRQTRRMLSEWDLIGATASLMQSHLLFKDEPRLRTMAKAHAPWLARQASNAFYDGHGGDSVLYLELAAGLDPECGEVLHEAITPIVQGARRAREALAYAVLAARIDPERDEVEYVEELIRNEELKEIGRWGTS